MNAYSTKRFAVRLCGLLFFAALFAGAAFADAGVLLPRDKQQPDPSVLSLDEMAVTIVIDNGDAHVSVRQVFANHTKYVEEGQYIFALPSHATISDFAVWDGPVRIPAVILERKRAQQIYDALKQQSIDPGLLQMGERDADEARKTSVFSAKIVPIPAYATKRLELEYHETIPVENLRSYFAFPLRPDAYHMQAAGLLTIDFELRSAHPIRHFQVGGKVWPLHFTTQNPNLIKGNLELRNVDLSEDFSVQYDLDPEASDSLRVITYRKPDSDQPDPTVRRPEISHNEPGFFEAEALLGDSKVAATTAGAASAPGQTGRTPRNLIVLFDTSLSMQWEKLDRSYQAMTAALHTLGPGDSFNLLLFNSQVNAYQPAPVSVTGVTLGKAIQFVQASRLRGGTDLDKALQAALAQCAQAKTGNNYLLLLSDGGATRGVIRGSKIAAAYAQQWKALPETQRPRTFIFAVGDDANLPLLKMLASNEGVLENVLSTEPIDFKLESFLSKIGRRPISDLGLNVSPQDSVKMVYPLQAASFSKSMASWVGQYGAAKDNVNFEVHGVRDAESLNLHTTANLPEKALEHPQLPRLWARARVDALLEKIERDGEDEATIDEIIRLSRKYKFVTPYTSFLAVPRALLRPRVIRPGDPVLRVHTDPSIVSVVAVFPFGLTKPLRYLAHEDVWQTRFLAPSDMRDGVYEVRLVLRDRNGNYYRESKSFVIASKPPVVKVLLGRKQYHRGETIDLRVSASESTRTLTANLEGAAFADLRWNQAKGVNTGLMAVPEDMQPGSYRLTVNAEDIAHNTSTQEVQIEVLP